MQMRKITLVFLFAIVLFVPISSFAQTTPWHDNTMSYRHQITVNSAQVSGNTNLVNFPVLVSIQNGSNLNSNNIQSSGADIRFYDNSGNNLDFEIESFSTNNVSGSLTAWVRIPSMSATTDSIIWLYHGNTTVTDTQNPNGVWNSDYVTVAHLSDLDDELSATNLTNSGTSFTAGQISQAIDLSSPDTITIPSLAWSDNSPVSVSFWMQTASSTQNAQSGIATTITNRFSFDSPWIGNFYWDYGNISGQGRVNTNQNIYDGNWHYITLTSTGNNSPERKTIYIDGSLVISQNSADAPSSISGNNFVIGTSYTGQLDEFRISDTVRGANWISTEYNNQNTPNTFLTIGTMENRPVVVTPPAMPTTTPTTNQNSSNSIDGGLFILMLILSLLCFVLSVKYGTALLFVTIILTLSLGVTLVAGYDVVTVETTTVNDETFTTIKCFICNNGEWLGWILFLFGILSLMFFLVQTFRGN